MARKDDQTVGGVLLIYFRGFNYIKVPPCSKGEGVMPMVTWNELSAYSGVIIDIITLVVTIMKKK